MPHTGIQPLLFSEYLVDDYESVLNKFSNAGMNIVFTGHFHSQDTSSAECENGTFYDVETGSLVTYPCPERFVTLNGNTVSYTTKNVDSVAGVNLNERDDFVSYAQKFLTDGMVDTYKAFMPVILISQGYATVDTASLMTEQILAMDISNGYTVENLLTSAFESHYKGDEKMSSEIKAVVSS